MNQRQAIEALAKWGRGLSWAIDYYASLMRENVAAFISHVDGDRFRSTEVVTWATEQALATIQSLVEGASDD